MKLYLNKIFLSLFLTSSIGVMACSSELSETENAGAHQNVRTEIGAARAVDSDIKKSRAAPQTSAESVAGSYEYDTYSGRKEGYRNMLEITEKNGELSISVSGMYFYPVNDIDETFKSAEGTGEGKLSGDTAKIELLDESDAICHATIKFAVNQATLKVSEACQFNIVLDGVYKKVRTASGEAETKNQARLPQIEYGNLMNFVNDHNSHQVGEEYVITKVSPAKLQKKIPAGKNGEPDYKDLFYLEESDDDGYIGNGLLISREMLGSLGERAKTKAASLRMRAILAESKDNSDWIYRMSFVTKIEALDAGGKVLWTAESAPPQKINLSHQPL